MEIWKDIKGYEGYQASPSGKVRKGDRIIKEYSDKRGYYFVCIKNNKGEQKRPKIHHVIWDTFGVGERDGHKKQIDHIDDNPQNNNIENLQLVTASQNSIKRSSLKSKSSKYPNINACRDNKWEMSIMRDRKRYRKNGFHTETEAFLYRQKLLLTIGESIS